MVKSIREYRIHNLYDKFYSYTQNLVEMGTAHTDIERELIEQCKSELEGVRIAVEILGLTADYQDYIHDRGGYKNGI